MPEAAVVVEQPCLLHDVTLPRCDQYEYLKMIRNNNGNDFQASFQNLKRIDSMKAKAVFLNARGFSGRGWSQGYVLYSTYRAFLRPFNVMNAYRTLLRRY
jgi:hypothetical protein